MTLSRRSFFAGLAAAIAAPAVVKAEILMPVKVWKPETWQVRFVDMMERSNELLDTAYNSGPERVRRLLDALSAPNDLLDHLTFQTEAEAVDAANRAMWADAVVFGSCAALHNPERKEILVGYKIPIPAGEVRRNVTLRGARVTDFDRSHFVRRPSWWFG